MKYRNTKKLAYVKKIRKIRNYTDVFIKKKWDTFF